MDILRRVLCQSKMPECGIEGHGLILGCRMSHRAESLAHAYGHGQGRTLNIAEGMYRTTWMYLGHSS